MPRPARLDEQRGELLPILAEAFRELGYRRATTAELARRCGVRENILYRHWSDKSAMFVAALEHVHQQTLETWSRVAGDAADRSAVERLLDHEAKHLGEFGNYRIIFSALGDTDDPAIADALKRMYRSFFTFVAGGIEVSRDGAELEPPRDEAAWAILGVGTIATLGQELGLISKAMRRRMIANVGRMLVAAEASSSPR